MYTEIAKDYDKFFKYNPKITEFIDGFIKKRPACILDIGCGTGKYTGSLSANHVVTGIDPDAESIRLASLKYNETDFYETDLLSFKSNKKFDLIYSVGNVTAHILKTDFSKFIQTVKSLLVNGGIWVFQTMNWDEILKNGFFVFPLLEGDGVEFKRQYTNLSKDKVDFITKLTLNTGKEIDNSIHLYPQTEAEIKKSHRGFKLLNVYGNFDKAKVAPNIYSKVFVFKKALNNSRKT